MKPEGGPTKIITIWQDWRGEERSRVPGALKGLREVFLTRGLELRSRLPAAAKNRK